MKKILSRGAALSLATILVATGIPYTPTVAMAEGESWENSLSTSITSVINKVNQAPELQGQLEQLQSDIENLQVDITVTGLSVKDVTDDSVTIQWDACEGVTGYNIYWADKDTTGMVYKKVDTVNKDQLTYTFQKSTHVNHYFKVAPVFESGEASLSEAVKSNTENQFQVQLETLDRGLVAMVSDGSIFLSWRLMADEVTGYGDDGLTGVNFNVYRNGEKIATVKDSTNYLDTEGTAADTYYVEAIDAFGTPLNQSEDVIIWQAGNYIDIPLQVPSAGTIDREITLENYSATYTYTANDVSVGDVDGDGAYEYFVKWDPSNSKDVSQKGFTGHCYIDCYKLDGTLLYRIDLGDNIRAGAHYT
ncbi:MAG: hypothetical protein ACLRZ7_11280, partial [Lachnospiraceae bacterium]